MTTTATREAPPELEMPAPVQATTGRTDRNGFLDAVRAIAIARVVIWHTYGRAAISYFVAAMPAMFFVSGSLLAGSLDRRRPTVVLRDRLRRILIPLWVFATVALAAMGVAWLMAPGPNTSIKWWQPLAWILPITDPTGSPWEAAWLSRPLWYLRAFLWLLLVSPLLLKAVRKAPVLALGLPIVGVFATDQMLRNHAVFGWELLPSQLADLVLFGFFLMLGFLHHDGVFERLSTWTRVVGAAGFGALAVLWCTTQTLPEGVVNNSYPAHLLVGLAWLWLFLAAEPILAAVPRVRVLGPTVTLLNRRALTIYLWHTTAIIVGYQMLWRLAPDLTGAPYESAILVMTIVLSGVLVVLFGWVEDVAARRAPELWPVARGPRPVMTTGARAAQRRRRKSTRLLPVLAGALAIAVGSIVVLAAAGPPDATVVSAGSETAATIATRRLPPAPSAKPQERVVTKSPTTTNADGTPAPGDPDPKAPIAGRGTNPPAIVADAPDRLERVISDWQAAHGVEGVMVSVSRPGPNGFDWSGALGTDPETGRVLQWDRDFAIASITKTFTAVVAMQLVQEGLLKLDEPVPPVDGVPSWPTDAGITLRELLDHSSGIIPYRDSEAYRDSRVYTPAQAIEVSLFNGLYSIPGTDHGYSNSGFFAIGLLIEQVTGHSYAEEVQTRIIEPLGLEHTYLDERPIAGWVGYSAGGLRSTPQDLDRFAIALWHGGRLLTPVSLETMRPLASELGLGAVAFCPCWGGEGALGYSGVGHDGGDTSLQWLIDDQLAVSIWLTEPFYGSNNLVPDDAYALVRSVADAVTGRT